MEDLGEGVGVPERGGLEYLGEGGWNHRELVIGIERISLQIPYEGVELYNGLVVC